MTEEEIQAEIAKTKGWDTGRKLYHYRETVVTPWMRSGYDEGAFDAFSDNVMRFLKVFYKWDESPPVWCHGGPRGFKAGDTLLSYPDVPSARKNRLEYINDRLKLAINPDMPRYVYFTHSRALAIYYSALYEDGRTYRVQPEGKIQIDPEVFVHFNTARKDSEITLDPASLIPWLFTITPACRAPSATVLGPG